ncbi:MAG: protein TolR [Deltaproteobacteria bacterium]|nr:MAG: protein TolR [Deltaproteobacteria bacterium]
MTSGSGDNGLMSDINITPFVDVMLVLLIIFMVTAPMMVQGINVQLPEADSGPVSSDDNQLVVSIDKDGKVYINDLNVIPDLLGEKLKRIIENRVGKEVYLRADKSVSYGVVVHVMSEIKGAGIEKLGMLTEPITK